MFQFSTVRTDECEEELSNLRSNQSSGLDGIPTSVLKISSEATAHPVRSIFNGSLDTSVFPSEWKYAHVKPLHKGGDKLSLSSYHPISLLPILSKTLERVVHKQLVQHLTNTHLLYPLQSGFRSGQSTTIALLHCTNDWFAALDHGLSVGVLYLDVSKACDTVDYSLLVKNLC